MTYVPIVTVPVQQQQPTQQTRELADLLGRVIQEYEKAHPSVSGPEVRHALQLARSASSKASGAHAGLIAGLAGGLALLTGLGVFFFIQADGTGGPVVSMRLIMVAIVSLGILAVVLAARRNL